MARWAWVFAVLSTSGAACQVDLGLDVKRFACQTDGDCAAGYVCRPNEVEDETWICIEGDESTGVGCVNDSFCAGELSAGQCEEAVCAQGACVVEPTDGAVCDDGDLCTTGDACDGATCVGAPVTCGAVDDCHLSGQCEPSTGGCSEPTKPDGEVCDDGDACTQVDLCAAGVCVGSQCECRNDTDCAGVVEPGWCQRAACLDYACAVVTDPEAGGTSCDDGDPCTDGDACSGGSCEGQSKDCSGLDGACAAGVCEGGACVAELAAEGTGCVAGDPCVLDAACAADGACAGTWDSASEACGCGADVDCASLSSSCNLGTCDLETHGCVASPLAGEPCDDGDATTTDDACSGAGVCQGMPYDCPGGPPCVTRVQVGDGTCTEQLAPGWCLIDGACHESGAALAGDACQVCAPDQATEGWSPAVDGASCDADGDPCTAGDACESGVCEAGGSPCDDGLACTTNTCSPDDGDPSLPSCAVEVLAGSCAIDGQCVSDGGHEVGNTCSVCDVAESQVEWVHAPDRATCGGVGRCLRGACVLPSTLACVPAGTFYAGCDPTTSAAGECECSEIDPVVQDGTGAFQIEATEVTAAQYELCELDGPCEPVPGGNPTATYKKAGREHHPVNFVTWDDAKAYCENAFGESPRRLCTELEWEKAARGGCEFFGGSCKSSMYTYPWGTSLGAVQDKAVFAVSQTEPVTDKPGGASLYGVLGMAGNVAEWVADDYDPATAEPGCDLGAAGDKVLRGGSFLDTAAAYLRVSARRGAAPQGQPASRFGFRCCVTVAGCD